MCKMIACLLLSSSYSKLLVYSICLNACFPLPHQSCLFARGYHNAWSCLMLPGSCDARFQSSPQSMYRFLNIYNNRQGTSLWSTVYLCIENHREISFTVITFILVCHIFWLVVKVLIFSWLSIEKMKTSLTTFLRDLILWTTSVSRL